jgi:hypothetical protein
MERSMEGKGFRRNLALFVGCWWFLIGSCCGRRHVTVGASRQDDHLAFVSSLRATPRRRSRITIPSFYHKPFSLRSTTIEEEELQDPTSSSSSSLSVLLSPEQADPLNRLLEERSRARWQGNYTHADALRDQLQTLDLPPGYQLVVHDIPRALGGGSTWTLVVLPPEQPSPIALPGPTVLQLAHAALGLAVESSVQNNLGRAQESLGNQRSSFHSIVEDDAEMERTKRLESIVQQAKGRLLLHNTTNANATTTVSSSVQYELSGRKAADAAFWWALAGVSDTELFAALVEIATQELQRFGLRPSCRSKDIYQILARFAAAGIRSAPLLEQVAQTCLEAKAAVGDYNNHTTTTTNDDDDDDNRRKMSLLDFHSDRSLLLIWKFSTKQKKQRAFLQSALQHWERHKQKQGEEAEPKEPSQPARSEDAEPQHQDSYDWDAMFVDTSRPLVVDIGCGMGVSLLGLASSGSHDTTAQASSERLLADDDSESEASISWSDCNFVGVDLGALGIGYARGLASRWGLDDRLQFVVDSAEPFVEQVQATYPGPVHLCLIQFPTPYRLKKPAAATADDHDDEESTDSSGGGNSQLPTSAHDGFMVTENLFRLVHKALSKTNGRLLLQSNCEDVAVWMRDLACTRVAFSSHDDDETTNNKNKPLHLASGGFLSTGVALRIPQRTADWIAMGGERADGAGWYEHPLLHREGATETEVACALNGTPVHRCLLKPGDVR